MILLFKRLYLHYYSKYFTNDVFISITFMFLIIVDALYKLLLLLIVYPLIINKKMNHECILFMNDSFTHCIILFTHSYEHYSNAVIFLYPFNFIIIKII